MKRTLKRELKVLEIVEREPIRSPKESAMIQTSQIGDSFALMFIAYSVACPKRGWRSEVFLFC
jgi:hypothetical protein